MIRTIYNRNNKFELELSKICLTFEIRGMNGWVSSCRMECTEQHQKKVIFPRAATTSGVPMASYIYKRFRRLCRLSLPIGFLIPYSFDSFLVLPVFHPQEHNTLLNMEWVFFFTSTASIAARKGFAYVLQYLPSCSFT